MDSALTAAWEKVFAEAKSEDLSAYESEGWITLQNFAARAGLSLSGARCAIERMTREKRLEAKKIRCQHGGKIREINICRPRI